MNSLLEQYNSQEQTPRLGETTDQFNRRTGRGFFLNSYSTKEYPITQSWEGDIIYWENEIKKAERMKSKAAFNHNEEVRKKLGN